jgi:signal transduction histidine kinase
MGLAITRAILAAHGGAIEASSVPGKGASFRFWVPLVEKEPANASHALKVSDAPPEAMDCP